MQAFIKRLHAKLGDFWWYSLMLFCACRAADLINAYIGIYLVPSRVEPTELGAVQPLTQFAALFALPVTIFATVFTREVTILATQREFGKLKSLLRGVFYATGVFLILAIALSRLFIPIFLEKIRIVEGSLGLVILASAFINAASPVYTNALLGLKKFKALSVLNIFGAPLRLVTLLITMPFRALTGYFVAQSAAPALHMVASVFCLRRELSHPAETYWTRPTLRRFARLLFAIGIAYAVSSATGLIEQLIIRQRLPDVESAAYYMTTRFAEIASYVTCTLSVTLFPFTAETAAQGRATRPLVLKAALAALVTSALLALFFFFAGEPILKWLPRGELYAPFARVIPLLILLALFNAILTFHINTEISAGRFAFLKWYIPCHLIYVAALYFCPQGTPFSTTNLYAVIGWLLFGAALRFAFTCRDLIKQ